MQRSMKISPLAAITLLLVTALPAQAQTGAQALYAQSLAANCASCHGTAGRATEGASITSLAGLDKNYFTAQMRAFKSGMRPATVMHQLSKGYSDAQIDAMAVYFAAQKP